MRLAFYEPITITDKQRKTKQPGKKQLAPKTSRDDLVATCPPLRRSHNATYLRWSHRSLDYQATYRPRHQGAKEAKPPRSGQD